MHRTHRLVHNCSKAVDLNYFSHNAHKYSFIPIQKEPGVWSFIISLDAINSLVKYIKTHKKIFLNRILHSERCIQFHSYIFLKVVGLHTFLKAGKFERMSTNQLISGMKVGFLFKVILLGDSL